MKSLAWEGDWPVSQYFGVNPTWYARFGLAGHNGLDVAMGAGTELYAPARARVVEVSYDAAGYGHHVKLATDDGQNWLFAHLNQPAAVAPGDQVEAGQLLGFSGSSGNSTGPHLHIGWRLLDEPFYRGWPFNGYVDPRQTLDRLQGGLWPPA